MVLQGQQIWIWIKENVRAAVHDLKLMVSNATRQFIHSPGKRKKKIHVCEALNPDFTPNEMLWFIRNIDGLRLDWEMIHTSYWSLCNSHRQPQETSIVNAKGVCMSYHSNITSSRVFVCKMKSQEGQLTFDKWGFTKLSSLPHTQQKTKKSLWSSQVPSLQFPHFTTQGRCCYTQVKVPCETLWEYLGLCAKILAHFILRSKLRRHGAIWELRGRLSGNLFMFFFSFFVRLKKSISWFIVNTKTETVNYTENDK